jgi:hypothetical protein
MPFGSGWSRYCRQHRRAGSATGQLRALEAFHRANPKSAYASFVLAYHYLVLGHVDSAIKQLENVVSIMPESQLAVQMLRSLKAVSPTPGGLAGCGALTRVA